MTSKPGQDAFQRLQELRAARDTAKVAAASSRPAPSRRDALSAAQARYDRCRNSLALEFQGLVKSRAKRFLCAGVELEDLAQEGLLGLLQALDGYDTSADATRTDDRKRFANYAIPYIDGAILRARPRNTQGHLSIGEYSVRYAERLAVGDSEAWNQLGNRAESGSAEELALDEAAAKARPERKLPQETVQALRSFKRGTVSLDAPQMVGPRARPDTLKDTIADESSPNPEELYAEKEQHEGLRRALEALAPAEARLLCWYYGVQEEAG